MGVSRIENSSPRISAIDVFCGAGGLTYGMRKAGIAVVAGIDLDPACRYPLTSNNRGTKFIEADVDLLKAADVHALFPEDGFRALVGCAPCQPFSPYAHGLAHDRDEKYSLVSRFCDLIVKTKPDVFSMENTLELKNYVVYSQFVSRLRRAGYGVTAYNVNCAEHGVPQSRKRLVVFGSLCGSVKLAKTKAKGLSVREAIGHLPPIAAGEVDSHDPLHRSAALSEINLARMKAAKPGGTWRDWQSDLRSPCHNKVTGSSFRSVYGRMEWDTAGPTITTQAFKFGTGRFGHPEQDRALSLREAALLQTFPPRYRFTRAGDPIHFSTVGRLIGNAVPVLLGRTIARSILLHLSGVTAPES
jgi:DNA (cytosine-5)-methyltransferase 1